MGTCEESFEVEYYDLPDGTYPAFDFIRSQPAKMSAKLTWTVALLEEHGNSLRMPAKTPPSEIERAKKYRNEYLSRNTEGK